MEIFDVIEQLEEIMESSFTLPIWHKTMVNKADVMELLSDLRLRLPEELKQAKWVKEERTRIITEAHQEASNIVKETEEQVKGMVNEHEITKKAYEQANEIIESEDVALTKFSPERINTTGFASTIKPATAGNMNNVQVLII